MNVRMYNTTYNKSQRGKIYVLNHCIILVLQDKRWSVCLFVCLFVCLSSGQRFVYVFKVSMINIMVNNSLAAQALSTHS